MQKIKNLNKFTKVVLAVVIVMLVVAAIGKASYNSMQNQQSNVDTVKRVISRDITAVSYPASYAKTWNGSITLFPKNYSTLSNQLSTNKDCSDITSGMNVYYTDDYSKLMIITNKDLYAISSDFENVRRIVYYQGDFTDNNGELALFKTYCGKFTLTLFAELGVKYPNTNASRTVVGIGSLNNMPDKIANVAIYIYIYAAKDD